MQDKDSTNTYIALGGSDAWFTPPEKMKPLPVRVFLTTMHRYPKIYHYEGHSYVIGVFSSREKAEKGGEDEAYCRAGKYTPVVEEFEIDAYAPLVEENDTFGINK